MTAEGLLKGSHVLLHTCDLTQNLRHEQNAPLSDCWQTGAVRGHRSLTHGWQQACLNVPSFDPGCLYLSSRGSTSCLCYLLLELKNGERDQLVWLWRAQAGWACHGLFQPFDTRLTPTEPEGKFCPAKRWGSCDGWWETWEWCCRHSGDSSFFLCAACPESDWLCPSQSIRLSFCLHTRRVSPPISFLS